MKPLVARRTLLSVLVVGILITAGILLRLVDTTLTTHNIKGKDVLVMLHSADSQQQNKGISLVNYVKHTDPELTPILDNLTDILLSWEPGAPQDQSLQWHAARNLVDKLALEELRKSDSPPLDPDKLAQLQTLFLAANKPAEMMRHLTRISGYTSRWQTEPQNQIAHIIKLLEASRQNGLHNVPQDYLLALEGHARHHDLPGNGMRFLLEIVNSPNQSSHSIHVLRIFKSIAARHPLPPNVRQTVVQIMNDNKDSDMRRESVEVLKVEAMRTGNIPAELYAAEKTVTDIQMKSVITNAIWQIKTNGLSTFEDWVAFSHDKSESGRDRVSAIYYLIHNHRTNPDLPGNLGKWLADDDALVRAEAISDLTIMSRHKVFKDHHEKLLPWLNAGINDQDASVRANSLSRVFQLYFSDEQKFSFAKQALHDKDPVVRNTLAALLQNKKLPHDKSLPFFLQLLQDEDTAVLITALNSVHHAGIEASSIRVHVERLATADDKELQKHARITLKKMVLDARSPLKIAVDIIADIRNAITDNESYGQRIFSLLVIVGVVIAAGFGLYFITLIFSYVSAGSSRSLAATVALVVWAGLTASMAGIFFYGAFGFGHNNLVPLQTQFVIDSAMALALVVFTSLGWLMKRLVRVRKENQPGLTG